MGKWGKHQTVLTPAWLNGLMTNTTTLRRIPLAQFSSVPVRAAPRRSVSLQAGKETDERREGMSPARALKSVGPGFVYHHFTILANLRLHLQSGEHTTHLTWTWRWAKAFSALIASQDHNLWAGWIRDISQRAHSKEASGSTAHLSPE